MRILIDARVYSTPAANRGMGRYVAQIIEDLATHHDVYLMTFEGLHANPIAEISGHLGGTVHIPMTAERASWQLSNEFTARVHKIVRSLAVDVLIDATPFLGPFRLDVDGVRTASVLYDLIPLHHADEYLPVGSSERDQYPVAARIVRESDLVICISQAVARDAELILGVSEDKILVQYPRLSREFLTESAKLTNIARSRNISLISGTHKSKGLKPFLVGLALARAQGLEDRVVVVLPDDHAMRTWNEWPMTLTRDVEVVAGISEEDKVRLIAESGLFVHPSIEEGYGIPMVEAQHLETVVLACDSRLSREIASADTVFYQPNDPEDLAQRLLSYSRGEFARTAGRRPGDLDGTRHEIHKRMRDLAALTSVERLNRKRVAVVGVLPPRHCGIGDYTQDFVLALLEAGHLVTFLSCDPEDVVPDLIDRPGIGFAPLSQLEHLKFDHIFVQLGMASWFAPMIEALVDGRFGKATLIQHDMNMTLGIMDLWANQLSARSIVSDVVVPELRGDAPLTNSFLVGALLDMPEDWRNALENDSVLNWATTRVASTRRHTLPRAGSRPTRPAEVEPLPMIVGDPFEEFSIFGVGEDEALARRQYLGSTVLGVYGNVVPTKKLRSVITATSILTNLGLSTQLEVVGGLLDDEYYEQLQVESAALGIANRVHFLGYVAPERAFDRMRGWHVGVVLRDPVAEGMSASVVRMLAADVPVVITDVEEWAHVQGDGINRVPPSDDHVREGTLVALEILMCLSRPKPSGGSRGGARGDYFQNHRPRFSVQRLLEDPLTGHSG